MGEALEVSDSGISGAKRGVVPPLPLKVPGGGGYRIGVVFVPPPPGMLGVVVVVEPPAVLKIYRIVITCTYT